jgi:hypothetical protein
MSMKLDSMQNHPATMAQGAGNILLPRMSNHPGKKGNDKMRNSAAAMVRMLWFTGVVMAGVFPVPGAKAQDAACTAKPGDEAAIVGTLRGMYAAATVDDRAKMRSYFAPGFYMFDGGNRYEGDSVMDLIEDSYKKGVRYVWSVTKPDVHVHCNEAWIAFVNEGSITKPDAGTTPMRWLESAVLERQGGGVEDDVLSEHARAGTGIHSTTDANPS